VPLRLPALRDRRRRPICVRHFVRGAVGEGLDAKTLDGEALELLKPYPWRKWRELENVAARMQLYPRTSSPGRSSTTSSDLNRPRAGIAASQTSDWAGKPLPESVEEKMRRYFSGFGEELPPSGPLSGFAGRKVEISTYSGRVELRPRQSDQAAICFGFENRKHTAQEDPGNLA